MKKLILPSLFIIGLLSVNAQPDKTSLLQSLEVNTAQNQDNSVTATVKTATRLFKAREDLTSVLMIIPAGSVVSVLDADSTYFHVGFEDNEGYIFRKHAAIDKAPATFREMQAPRPVPQVQPEQAPQNDSRYDALESKYGSAMASRLYAGKIWKGMNSEMARDSWGAAEKGNRVISGSVIKEEWIYRSTWLYFENNTLLDWGPVKR